MLVQKDIQIIPAGKSVMQGREILNYSVLQAGFIECPKQFAGNRQRRHRFDRPERASISFCLA
jgi:hypothetical protein